MAKTTEQSSATRTPTRRSVSASSRATASKSAAASAKTSSRASTKDAESSSRRSSARADSSSGSRASRTAQPAASGILAGGAFQKAAAAVQRTSESYRVAKDSRKHSNTLTIIIAVVAVIAIIVLLDFFLHVGRIHGNVYVGDVNLGGMKKSEAILELDNYYTKYLRDAAVTAYVSPNVKSQKQADDLYYMITVNDTYLENHPEIMTRVISASELEGAIASSDLVEDAFSYGRGLKGLFQRISLLFKPHVITPYCYYGSVALDSVIDSFNDSVGIPMRNSRIYIENGYVRMDEGQDGYTISREQLETALNTAFFSTDAADRTFVLYSSYTPMAIDAATTTAAVEALNNLLADGVVCTYDNHAWQASPITVGSWIRIDIVEDGEGGWKYQYSLDESLLHSWMLKWILADEEDSIPVRMEVAKDKVTVYPDVSGQIPALSEAVEALQTAMFGNDKQGPSEGALAADGVPVSVTVGSMSVPESMSIEDAIAKGVVSPISSFSTSYINGSTTDNRTHNVRLAAETVNGTVVKAGEEFSFNEIVGATTEERGYKVGSVLDWTGEYVDGYGGGVCQVSTTLFNAVFYAGFPITERLNHMVYSANYPAGMDATVDYPSVDFKWVNNTESDVYVSFTDDGTSVTCTLYGADPHYTVWAYTYPWSESGGYETRYLIDTSKNPGYSEVKSVGVAARRIVVWRKVLDPTATDVLIDETFGSNYRALSEYVIIGPGAFADEMLAAGRATYL